MEPKNQVKIPHQWDLSIPFLAILLLLLLLLFRQSGAQDVQEAATPPAPPSKIKKRSLDL